MSWINKINEKIEMSWEKDWGTVYRKRRTWERFVVQLGVDCSRDVDICLENSLGRFIDFKLSVWARPLLNFEGFVTQKWLE